MLLPGINVLRLNEESMRGMIEDSINAVTLEGEDYIYVHSIKFAYMGNMFDVELSTDKPAQPQDGRNA